MVFVDEEKYKKNIGIYKITNIVNGFVYIGQTTQGFQKRYWLHQTISKARTRIQKYKQTLCQSCAEPLEKEEG